MKLFPNEPLPELHDLLDRETSPERVKPVIERYEAWRNSAVFDTRFQAFHATFTMADGRPMPRGDWFETNDQSLVAWLQQELGLFTVDNNPQSAIEILENKQQINMGWHSTDTQPLNYLTDNLYSRLWLLLKLSLTDSEAAKKLWPCVKEEYFKQDQESWFDKPIAPHSKLPAGPGARFLAMFTAHYLGYPIGEKEYQGWLRRGLVLDRPGRAITSLLEILLLQELGCDREAFQAYQKVKSHQGLYDTTHRLWRQRPYNEDQSVYDMHDQLLGLLVERRFEKRGIKYDWQPLTEKEDPLPLVSRLPQHD